MRSFFLYTAGRLLVLFAVAAVLYALGLRGFVLGAFAVLISLPVAYVLLARQRRALGAEVERRVETRRARKTDLRSQLRGDD